MGRVTHRVTVPKFEECFEQVEPRFMALPGLQALRESLGIPRSLMEASGSLSDGDIGMIERNYRGRKTTTLTGSQVESYMRSLADAFVKKREESEIKGFEKDR